MTNFIYQKSFINDQTGETIFDLLEAEDGQVYYVESDDPLNYIKIGNKKEDTIESIIEWGEEREEGPLWWWDGNEDEDWIIFDDEYYIYLNEKYNMNLDY